MVLLVCSCDSGSFGSRLSALEKQTCFTITVSIILLWILFVLRRVSSLFLAVVLSGATLHCEGVSNAIINYRIFVLVYAVVLAVIALILTIIWTRNLRRLLRDTAFSCVKSLCVAYQGCLLCLRVFNSFPCYIQND